VGGDEHECVVVEKAPQEEIVEGGEDEGNREREGNGRHTAVYEWTFSNASKSGCRGFFGSFSSSLSASSASEFALGGSVLPINLGLRAKAPLGMKVERKMMAQATEKCTLSRERQYYRRLCVEVEHLPSDRPEGAQNILILREVLVDNPSEECA